MITVDINPVLFSLGPLSVRWYGLMYVVGITVGLLVAWPYARSKGITSAQLEKLVLYSVPAGFVGVRHLAGGTPSGACPRGCAARRSAESPAGWWASCLRGHTGECD